MPQLDVTQSHLLKKKTMRVNDLAANFLKFGSISLQSYMQMFRSSLSFNQEIMKRSTRES